MANQGIRNVRFLENLTCCVFLKHPFLDSPFCLITDETVGRKGFKYESLSTESLRKKGIFRYLKREWVARNYVVETKLFYLSKRNRRADM